MSGARPSRPLEDYPAADLSGLPPPPPEPEGGAAATPAPAPPEVAVLRFLDPARMEFILSLAHPFEWEGAEVREVIVRRLNVAQVGQLVDAAAEGSLTFLDAYALMTGLPAAVLRAMEGGDGDRVIEACRPFSPRFMVDGTSSPTSALGDATPSSPAAP